MFLVLGFSGLLWVYVVLVGEVNVVVLLIKVFK